MYIEETTDIEGNVTGSNMATSTKLMYLLTHELESHLYDFTKVEGRMPVTLQAVRQFNIRAKTCIKKGI
ncbi:hypothetical protein MSLAZ_2543 [Methanosarcina lacustris Z-7289]|uniref:Uncharacterized protein n=1 Tax=Methanosarcina lacustris Z-7289 TaxID=1434111 RepID=A0A0E3S454_9EURY|nr:hypothetical protein [Methanosarcina lacustris]AKB75804.1 hypothetical protein MSLAZ_2543 [Methanosarcina lacustris Z-7289]